MDAGHVALDEIRAVFAAVVETPSDAILQVGIALPVVALIEGLETRHNRPVVACNAAVYWQTLRGIGIADPVRGFGHLLAAH